jgi:hypothetical protein
MEILKDKSFDIVGIVVGGLILNFIWKQINK